MYSNYNEIIIITLLSICPPLRRPAIVTIDFSITSSAYCTTFFCNKAWMLLTPWGRVSCISKTACFLVNRALLSLQFGRNEELKGSNGSRPWECDYRTPPSKLDTAPFWHVKPQPIRGFPAIEPVTFRHRQ